MRAANVLWVAVVVQAAVSHVARADEADRLLGMALAEAQLGHCPEALAHLDQYLKATDKPSPDAFAVLRRCPRTAAAPTPAPASAAPRPPAATGVTTAPAKQPRPPRFWADLELGLNVPLTAAAPEAAFLGAVEFGVVVAPRVGLAVVLLGESIVSRAEITPGAGLSTVFSENLVAGVEERRLVWRRLSVFGTVAGGILVDTYKGFRDAVAIHLDAGAGWTLGPGELRLRPLDFGILVETDGTVGASWRATAGYALRF